MKKYLREIEASGMILMAIGIILALIVGSNYGMWPCIVGVLLWVITIIYKAIHWNEYTNENKKNIAIMLIAILIILVKMIFKL